MSKITYFVVQPFEVSKRGRAVPATPIQAQSAAQAMRMAERLAAKGGAVAFSRTGDPETGDFDDAVVLASIGEVPIELAAVA